MMFRTACLIAAWCVGAAALAGEPTNLPRSAPEAQGVSSSALLSFVEAADATQTMHSLVVLRHGQVVAEGWWSPYAAESPHSLYSLTKSFTSTAIGFAVAEGKLSIDDPVLSFFPELAPKEPSENLKQMRVRDLLSMNAGQTGEVDFWHTDEVTKAFLSHPVPFKPGTHFMYNTPASYMLSAILQKVNGVTTEEYLTPRLFEPLGFGEIHWEKSKEGVSQGGFGLSVRTEDIAKLGQLYLQKGNWNGSQVLPAAWVQAASLRQTSNGSNPNSDWEQGYGYQFWRCRHDGFRGDGAFGQFCVVLPKQDAVIAITSGVGDMQGVLNLVWDELLPAFEKDALPEDAAAHDALQKKLAGLTLIPLKNSVEGAEEKIAGKTFEFPENDQKLESAALETDDAGTTLILKLRGEEQRVAIGNGEWKKGRMTYGVVGEQPVAASGGWTAADTFTAKLCFYETPFIATLKLTGQEGDRLMLESKFNVGFGPTALGPIEGMAKK